MRVRIHRGAHEIGGSCVEVESDGPPMVLDVGRPLNAGRGDQTPLPPIAGLADGAAPVAGVVISHAHQDHWGLADQVAPGVPIVMGAATSRILREAAFWTTGLTVEPAAYLEHRVPLHVGPFRITPYLNDHSAFDAYSLLVEADGRRLFYSGDIRGHGRKAALFEQLLRDPPKGIDVAVMEGTNIRPGVDGPDDLPSESDIEQRCVPLFRATEGASLVLFSAQNIDRLVTMYRAALRAGRDLVVDLYTASIAKATENPNIPQLGPQWPNMHVYVPQWQRVKVKESGEFWRVNEIAPYRLFAEHLAETPARFVVKFDRSAGADLERAGALDGAAAIWSMWSGYLSEPSGVALCDFFDRQNVPLSVVHTSGHASIVDLQRLNVAMAPARVVPIHSFGAARFDEYFDHVDPQADGVWWDV